VEEEPAHHDQSGRSRLVPLRWLAHPRTLRLSTRPRRPPNPDGSRARSFNRISRSCPLPNLVFHLNESVEALAEKLVHETLIPSFRKLHPEKSGWNLSLVNIAVTNMAEAAAESKDSKGRDIGKMFKTQESVLREWRVEDRDVPPSDSDDELSGNENEKIWTTGDVSALKHPAETQSLRNGSAHANEAMEITQSTGFGGGASPSRAVTDKYVEVDGWVSDDDDSELVYHCSICKSSMPEFAASAHMRFHEFPD